MASKKKAKSFAPKEAQDTFAGAVEKARQPVGPMERPEETQVEPDMKSGKRKKNNSENPFVRKNA